MQGQKTLGVGTKDIATSGFNMYTYIPAYQYWQYQHYLPAMNTALTGLLQLGLLNEYYSPSPVCPGQNLVKSSPPPPNVTVRLDKSDPNAVSMILSLSFVQYFVYIISSSLCLSRGQFWIECWLTELCKPCINYLKLS